MYTLRIIIKDEVAFSIEGWQWKFWIYYSYVRITQIMAKEATNPKPSVQIDIYCQAVHKNVYTLEYAGAKKQIIDFVIFLSYSFFFLIQNSWLA